MKTAVQIVIVAVLVHLMWNVGPVYVKHREFREALLETARDRLGQPEGVIRSRTLEVAASFDIPLAAERAQISRGPNRTYIDTSYTVELPLLPRFTYLWTFNISVDRLVVRPPVVSDYTP